MRSLNPHSRGRIVGKGRFGAVYSFQKCQPEQKSKFSFGEFDAASDEPFSAIVRRIGNDVVRPRLRHQKIDSDLAKTAVVEVSAANRLAGFFQNPGHGVVAAGALPNLT